MKNKKKTRGRQNYNPLVSVHNADDLKFQQYQFDHRLPRKSSTNDGFTLSNGFFHSTYGSKTLTGILGGRIARAGDILR